MQIQQPFKEQGKKADSNELALIEPKPIWKPKAYNTIYPVLSVNHICNIEDSFFINQKSLKDPQHEEESFLKTIFYFKSVSRVEVSENYITLHLKKRIQNYLPKQYFIERFKSFGNREFYDIAIHLQHISQHLKQIKSLTAPQQIKQHFSRENQEKILEQSLEKLDRKKFFCFFYEFTQQGSSLNRIIISKTLLKALGYDYEDIVIDFLKFQEAIFEIISTKLYCLVMEKKSQLVDQILRRMKQQVLSSQQIKQYTMFRFTDDLTPKALGDSQADCDRKIRSRIKFSKTHPSVTIFEVEKMNKKPQLTTEPKNSNTKLRYLEHQKMIKSRQYETVKNLLKVSENMLQENSKILSSYRYINPQAAKRARKMQRQQSSDSQYLGFD